jgi:diguanylate cyclase (GGDEF)-like protein
MRAPAALLLAAALLASAGLLRAEAPTGDGTDAALQRDMERLYALRTVDPQAFVAQTRSLESLPAPSNVAQREFLRFLTANRAALDGRFSDAIALAKPLGESAEDPALRLLAGGFVVNMRAGTRDFEAGLRELAALLDAHPDATGHLRDEVLGLWSTAAIFYAELEQPALSAWYAQRLVDSASPPRLACLGRHLVVRAQQAEQEAALSDADFDAANRVCAEAGEGPVAPGFLALSHARFLRDRRRLDDALALLADRLGAIESTRYPRLVAEAYALDAELLLAAERLDDAERQARHAVDVAKATPTSLPVAMAEKVLYEVARRRGDAAATLGHLQRHLAAERALAEERHIKAMAFSTVQHETLQRDQALRLGAEKSRVLDLEARVAKAESRNALILAGLLLLSLGGMAAYGRRLWRSARHFRHLAQTDALTGFAARQHFTELAQAAVVRAHTRGQPLMLVAFDLDHFKRINDRHGHLAGDAVLRNVSEAVRSHPSGRPGIVGRVGGEEFAIVLENATPAEATAHAETLRAAIASVRTAIDGGTLLTVTASFGVTGTHECGHDLTALLDRVDRTLYRAKNGGRDRVIVADHSSALEAA